jgi:hypothetical protein
MGDAYPCVDRARGGRRHGQRLASESQAHLAQMRPIAPPEGLSQPGGERLEQAERGVPKRPATSACVSGDVTQQGAQLALPPPVSLALHATLLPSSSLERGAGTRPRSDGAPLRALAERRRASWVDPGGV